jgi:hypothetical protein
MAEWTPDQIEARRIADRIVARSQESASVRRSLVVGDGLVIHLSPARRAQLEHRAKWHGLTLEQMVSRYVESGLDCDFDCGGAFILTFLETTDPLVRKKQRLFRRYFYGKINLAQFRKLAAQIDGGEWAVPLYSRSQGEEP